MDKSKTLDILDKLIRDISREIDYWLLNVNQEARKKEYGDVVYKKIAERQKRMRTKVLKAMFDFILYDGDPMKIEDFDKIKRSIEKKS